MDKKSIMITGCSSGIGLYTAEALVKRGYNVFATARDEKSLQHLQSLGCTPIKMDVNEAHSITEGIAKISQQCQGKLYGLFNNAGYLEAGAIEDLTSERILRQFKTNTFAPMEIIRQVLPLMRKEGRGRIIQNSSILGIVTLPYCGAYNASKFALEGFSNTLRQELRGSDIFVSIINPGPITSNLRDTAFKHFNEADLTSSQYQTRYKKMEQTYFNVEAKLALGPDAVYKKVLHALESSHPNAHYFIGITAHVMAFLRRVLPDSALDFLISKAR